MLPVIACLKKPRSVSEIFIGPPNISVQSLVCFQSFTKNKLLASSLLCVNIFTFVLTGTI